MINFFNSRLPFTSVKETEEEITINVLKNDSSALEYIENQSEKICLHAVKTNGYALKFVLNQTPLICLVALRKNNLSIKHVRDLASIAPLLSEKFIQKNLELHPKYKELKEIKQRIKMNEDALGVTEHPAINTRRSKARI